MKAVRKKKQKVVEQTETEALPTEAASSVVACRGSSRKKLRRSQNQIHDQCSSLLPSDTCAKHAEQNVGAPDATAAASRTGEPGQKRVGPARARRMAARAARRE